VPDQILAESIRVSDKVAQSSSCVRSSLLLLIFEQIDEKFDTRAQMLVQDLVMEPGIADCEAGKLPRVPIRVLAARDGSLDQAVLEELLVEISRVSAQVSNQVAYLGPDSSIFMADQRVQVNIDVCIVDWLVELF